MYDKDKVQLKPIVKGTYPLMTSNGFCAKIKDIKTYLQRWWVINRLYHYRELQKQDWVQEERFLWWIVGIDIEIAISEALTRQNNWKRRKAFITRYLFGSDHWENDFSTSDNGIRGKIQTVIRDCENNTIAYIIRRQAGNNGGFDYREQLNLQPRGKEDYAFSSLVYNALASVSRIWIIIFAIISFCLGINWHNIIKLFHK